MAINLTDFLRGNLFGKIKEIVRLIVSLGAVNVDLAVDRMLTPPESKLRELAKELKLSEAQTTEFIAEVRAGCDRIGNAVALAAKAQLD